MHLEVKILGVLEEKKLDHDIQSFKQHLQV